MTHLPPDNVGDLHQVIVHHICQMICREPVRLEDDKVLLGILLPEWPVDRVPHRQRAEGIPLEAHDVSLTGGRPGLGLGCGQGAASLGVDGGLDGLVLADALGLELGGVAEAAVGVAGGQEAVYVFLVDWEPLGLASDLEMILLGYMKSKAYLSIGAIRTATVRPFIPRQTKPLQIIDDGLFRSHDQPILIRVLNTQNERASPRTLRSKIVEQRRPQRAEVQMASWRRSEACSDWQVRGLSKDRACLLLLLLSLRG